jgi:hypothetical protein
VKRRILQYSLLICLLLSAAFAAWTWLRPYDFKPDPAARCEILETLVTRDQSFFWVNVHLKVNPGMPHDLQIPVSLATANGPKQPADTTFAGTDPLKPEEIWFKFWLEPADLAGPLTLEINGGKLPVKTLPGLPDLGSDTFRNFTTNRW